MKLEGAVFKTLRKAQGSVTLEYLAEGSCGYKNIYMDSRKDPLGATKPQQNWESPWTGKSRRFGEHARMHVKPCMRLPHFYSSLGICIWALLICGGLAIDDFTSENSF